jgi:hypothetical protein
VIADMSLTFKTKSTPRTPDEQCKKLAEFLLSNIGFIAATFEALAKRKDPINDKGKLNTRILILFGFKYIKSYANFQEYTDLLFNFYNTTSTVFDVRRGCLLEEIVSKIKPVDSTVKNYSTILECLVYNNGKSISKNDVDVVFEYSDIELIECKACLKNSLYEPLSEKTKGKLNLIQTTQFIAKCYFQECYGFFASYDSTDKYTKEVLSRNGYTTIKVLTKSRIVDRLAV